MRPRPESARVPPRNAAADTGVETVCALGLELSVPEASCVGLAGGGARAAGRERESPGSGLMMSKLIRKQLADQL
ncbi:hypothetical protein NDU88_004203 [Pleurodeles waltl]|uniref:Uncharacterized protein n=1 Tax=Pleurodeles waltl TaxID=8319 RepID=A0AAV7VK20_PLEWA|nr:hypothetical protein NDU88_004203 [Pleurodeles waltl]